MWGRLVVVALLGEEGVQRTITSVNENHAHSCVHECESERRCQKLPPKGDVKTQLAAGDAAYAKGLFREASEFYQAAVVLTDRKQAQPHLKLARALAQRCERFSATSSIGHLAEAVILDKKVGKTLGTDPAFKSIRADADFQVLAGATTDPARAKLFEGTAIIGRREGEPIDGVWVELEKGGVAQVTPRAGGSPVAGHWKMNAGRLHLEAGGIIGDYEVDFGQQGFLSIGADCRAAIRR